MSPHEAQYKPKEGTILFNPTPTQAMFMSLGLAAAGALTDIFVPRNIFVPFIYTVPLLLTAWVNDSRFLWGLTAALTALNFAQSFIGAAPILPENESVANVNRFLSACQIVVIGALVQVLVYARQYAEDRQRTIERQRDDLEAANLELSQREEEIVRQNEELQAQAEELERQSEELRITNEQLAGREKMLEQLLELSRSLTPELSRNETLRRICEALGYLAGNMPIAVLERQGEELAVVCHHGFGPDGPRPDRLPLSDAFSSLILARGQTGFLEDLELRPELKIPQPSHGDPFRSVLAAPLRIRGHAIGTIEVYSHGRHSWNESQVVLVESLAAQTAVSLAAAELVEAIQHERRRFESAFRTVPIGMAVAEDPGGEHVHVNPAGAAMLGVPLGENLSATTPMGARLRRYILRNEQPVALHELPLSRALHGEEVVGEELTFTLTGGRRLTTLTSAAPLYDSRGNITGAVTAFADITDQKNLQRELELRRREAEETSIRKTRFLAAVSHDIRTPVNAINLMAEVIRRYSGDPTVAAQIPDLAQKLQANARSLVELVSDVLDVARFDSGKVELMESEFALSELLAEEGRQILPLAQDKGLALVIEPLDRPLWLRTDKVKLARVVNNLIGNAIKFTEQGEVRVSCALTPHPDRRVQIRVKDTGVGIPEDQLVRIFDEFAQVHNPERDRSKGTGLGLAICKRLVEVMGGSITVESKDGKGSIFSVHLPASCIVLRLDSAYSPLTASKSAPALGRARCLEGLRILLVEDHTITREGTARLLVQEGAQVHEASDGRSALAQLKHDSADIILLDMMLPDLDGREVLRTLQNSKPPNLKGVLVLTGDLTPERLEEVKQLGADAVIGKPIDLSILAATLQTYRRATER